MLLAHETVYKMVWKNVIGENCEQEFCLTPDGGTVGVLWQIDDDKVGRPPTVDEECEKRKPILLIAVGL